MSAELGTMMGELGRMMRLFRASQENGKEVGDLSERDILLLELLDTRGRMTITEIASAYPSASESTISMNITKLWRDRKLVSKTVNPENQRFTFVEITPKGRELIRTLQKLRAQRLGALLLAMEISAQEREVMERVISRATTYFKERLCPKGKECATEIKG